MRGENGLSNGTGLILAVMCLATFMAILDTSLVNLGLKSIQQDLGADTAALQWVIDLYNLTYAVFILTGGTLGDLYGRRRVFVLGVAVFAIPTLRTLNAKEEPRYAARPFFVLISDSAGMPSFSCRRRTIASVSGRFRASTS